MYIKTRDNISTFKDSSSDAGISTLLLYPYTVQMFSPGEAHNKCSQLNLQIYCFSKHINANHCWEHQPIEFYLQLLKAYPS